MMVVTMVSRRDGQVTLAVSVRTSCRNLNGLKAIVDNPRSSCAGLISEIRTALSRTQPSIRGQSRQAGSTVREIQSRVGCPSKRADSRCGYLLPAAGKVKGMARGALGITVTKHGYFNGLLGGVAGLYCPND